MSQDTTAAVVIVVLIIIAVVIVFCWMQLSPSASETWEPSMITIPPKRITKTIKRYNKNIYAFNPSAITHNGETFSVCRLNRHDKGETAPDVVRACSELTYDEIEDKSLEKLTQYNQGILQFQVNGEPRQYLHITKFDDTLGNNGYEDPRIFEYKGDIYVIAYKRDGEVFEGSKHKIVLNKWDGEKFAEEIYLSYSGRNSIEKNWLPFVHKGELLIIYSYNPIVILKVEDPQRQDDRLVSVCTVYHQGPLRKLANNYSVGLSAGPVLLPNKKQYLVMAHVRQEHGNLIKRKNFFFLLDSATFIPSDPSPVVNMISENIEFCLSMELYKHRLMIDLGVNDCQCARVEFNLAAILSVIPTLSNL